MKASARSSNIGLPRNTNHQQKNQYNSSLKDRNISHNIKTVSIFIDNLDKQINQSYAKLKKNKQKLASGMKQSQYQQTTLYGNISLFPKLQQSPACNSFYDSYRNNTLQISPKSNQKQDIVFLDNRQVLEYIHLVYDLYNIKNPLEEQKQYEDNKNYMTNKKIKNYKDNCHKQIGSASTMKNSYMYKSIQLKPFSDSKKNHLRKQTSSTKIQLVSLHSKKDSNQIIKNKQKISFRQPSSTYRFKNQNTIQRKQKINLNSHRINNNNTALASVPQLFRFCFMCEQPILEYNINSHENTCLPLKQALHKSFQELIMILDAKIMKLTSQIESDLVYKAEQKIKQEFTMIKNSVKIWISKLPLNSNQSQVSSSEKNWRGQFNKIQENISKSVCSSFHLIHKLQWFSKLRQNITLKYFEPK